MSDGVTKYSKDYILCRKGDIGNDLFYILKGTLLVCIDKGSEVIPLAYLKKGEFFGELSFFDKKERSAHVICLEDCELIKINGSSINDIFPDWCKKIGISLSKSIRLYDDVILSKGIKKKSKDSLKALTIDEQRFYSSLLNS